MGVLTTFTVEQSSTNATGGFVIKLSAHITKSGFGMEKTFKRTFYIGGMPKPLAKGTKIEEDLDKFEIIVRQAYVVKDATGKPTFLKEDIAKTTPHEVYNLKWLHFKIA